MPSIEFRTAMGGSDNIRICGAVNLAKPRQVRKYGEAREPPPCDSVGVKTEVGIPSWVVRVRHNGGVLYHEHFQQLRKLQVLYILALTAPFGMGSKPSQVRTYVGAKW